MLRAYVLERQVEAAEHHVDVDALESELAEIPLAGLETGRLERDWWRLRGAARRLAYRRKDEKNREELSSTCLVARGILL